MKKKSSFPKGEKIQGEFDRFTKNTIRLAVRKVLEEYQKQRERIFLVGIEEAEEIAAPEVASDLDKIKVVMGSTSIYLDDEKLAEGIKKKLDEKQRQILGCFFVEDMPAKAIGELMDLQEKTIFNYKYEALGILRKYMEGYKDGR